MALSKVLQVDWTVKEEYMGWFKKRKSESDKFKESLGEMVNLTKKLGFVEDVSTTCNNCGREVSIKDSVPAKCPYCRKSLF